MVDHVTMGHEEGYDWFAIYFTEGIPTYTVSRQFTTNLEGTSVVWVHTVSATWMGATYGGAQEFHPQFQYLREVLLTTNREGMMDWALGVQGTPFVRVRTVTSQHQLVVEIAAVQD